MQTFRSVVTNFDGNIHFGGQFSVFEIQFTYRDNSSSIYFRFSPIFTQEIRFFFERTPKLVGDSSETVFPYLPRLDIDKRQFDSHIRFTDTIG